MTDTIFLVNPETKKLKAVYPVKLSDIGMREVQDLEEWVKNHPEILGDEFLIISSEFNRFDKSNRRIDVLAVDKKKKLVVIELKLEADKTFADLQAIRYAAFCSTMVTDDIVEALSRHRGVSPEDSRKILREYWNVDELPDVDDKPRIVLAASSFDDQELTSTVLWLRTFEVDISCVELTPYKIADTKQIILVPKVLIPLPEAKEYQVRVERKQATQAREKAISSQFQQFWEKVAARFNETDSKLKIEKIHKGCYQQIQTGIKSVHYEFLIRRGSLLDIAIHYETQDKDKNYRMLSVLLHHKDQITKGITYEFSSSPAENKHASAFFTIPCENGYDSETIITQAVNLMNIFIDRTLDILRNSTSEE